MTEKDTTLRDVPRKLRNAAMIEDSHRNLFRTGTCIALLNISAEVVVEKML